MQPAGESSLCRDITPFLPPNFSLSVYRTSLVSVFISLPFLYLHSLWPWGLFSHTHNHTQPHTNETARQQKQYEEQLWLHRRGWISFLFLFLSGGSKATIQVHIWKVLLQLQWYRIRDKCQAFLAVITGITVSSVLEADRFLPFQAVCCLYAAVLLCFSLMDVVKAKWHILFLETNHRNAVNLCREKEGGFTIGETTCRPYAVSKSASHKR